MDALRRRQGRSRPKRLALNQHGAFLDALDTTEMVKSYRMLVLLGMLNADDFLGGIRIEARAEEVERIATRMGERGRILVRHMSMFLKSPKLPD